MAFTCAWRDDDAMRRWLGGFGVVCLLVAVGAFVLINEQRGDARAECQFDRTLSGTTTACDLPSWWPAILLAVLAVVAFAVASRSRRPPA